MGFRKVCPNCAQFINSKDAVCPFCGEVLKNNKAELEVDEVKHDLVKSDVKSLDKTIVASSEQLNSEKDEENKSDLENDVNLQNINNKYDNENEITNFNNENAENVNLIKPKRHAHKKKNQEKPQVEDAGNGEYSINTDDVTFFEGAKANYSEKKARGEGNEEKIEWWEIYKWADLYLARKKIKKEVNKAAVVEPNYVNHLTLLLLCLFFGIFGAHNYYAKNYKKGVFVTISLFIALTVISIPQLKGVIDLSVGGGLGFVVVSMWIWDFISILTYRYKFRESSLKFICKLNLQTRKKLGKKYININEWFVPYEERKARKKSKKMRQTKI